MLQIATVAIFTALCTASILERTVEGSKFCKKHPSSKNCEFNYLASICYPGMYTSDVDLNAPCIVEAYLGLACGYGQKITVNKTGFESPNGPMQSKDAQRLCICESQYFEALQGCSDCFEAHGGDNTPGVVFPINVISSMSSAYCAATATPTLGFYDYELSYLDKPQFNSIFSSIMASATSTFLDPIGNKTGVSLYYTGAATRSAALNIGEFTGTAAPTTTLIMNGQIVATASLMTSTGGKTSMTGQATQVATERPSTSAGKATTSTGNSGARQTEAVLAGVLGLVGVVVML